MEQLRAQVKQTLAEMEYSAAGPVHVVEKPRLWIRLMRRFSPKTARKLALQA